MTTAGRRILVDGYFLGKPYGFGRYAFELIRALGCYAHDFDILVAVRKETKVEFITSYPNLTFLPHATRNYALWEQRLIPQLARTHGCAIIHAPYNTCPLFTGRTAVVTTVHDLIFLRSRPWGQNLREAAMGAYSKLFFRIAMRKSQGVIAISHTTQDLLKAYGVASTLAYNTVEGFLEVNTRPPRPLALRRHFLHRGGSAPHRNSWRVIQSFEAIAGRYPDIDLIIIGVAEHDPLRANIRNSRIKILNRVSDRELAELYASSLGVVVASLEEGFGLPIIEAFGFQAPVIASRRLPMTEIAGDAALFLDPTDTAAIATAMIDLIERPALARELLDRGRERIKAFDARRAVEAIAEVYRSVPERSKSA